MINLATLEPTVISRDLRGKFICIYGLPKVGKTSLSAQFPNSLILGFEHGWNALGGVYAIDIEKWADFKMALYQLENEEEVKNKFQTVVIDTIGLAWNSCMQYICMQHGVKEISAIPWGQGWAKASQEFEESLRKITQLGYGLVIIAHSDVKTEKAPDGSDVTILGPAIPTRAYNIVNQLVDLIGYIAIEYDAEGNSTRWLYTRKTPTIMAGSRFKYLPAKIKFGYQELVDAIAYALEKSEEDGDKVVDHIETNKNETLDYDALRKESEQLWNELVLANPDQPNTANAEKIHSIVSSITGMDIKISDITRAQVDLLNLIVVQMRALKG